MVECRSAVAKAVIETYGGPKGNLPLIADCRGNEGSKNWPVGWALAMRDFDRAAELLAENVAGGLGSSEAGSELYLPDVLVYWTGLLREAKAAGKGDLAAGIAAMLRAQWALLALCALETPRRKILLTTPEGTEDLGSGDDRYYTGLSVAIAGHRYHPSVLGQPLLGELLTWALGSEPAAGEPGFPLSYRRAIATAPGDPASYNYLLSIGALIAGVSFGQPVAATAFGLTDGDRAAMRRLIRGGDPAPVAAMLAGFRLLGPLVFTITATGNGRLCRLENAVNGMKPQIAAAAIAADGTYRAIVANSWNRLQAGLATTREVDGQVEASVRDRVCRFPALPGTEVWRVRFAESAVLTIAGSAAAPGATTVVPGPQPTPVASAANAPPPTPVAAATSAPLTPVVASATSAPPAPSPVVPSQPPPEPTVPDLAAIADTLAGLLLARDQRGFRDGIVAELRRGPTRPLSAIADDVATFGINPDQAQGPAWLRAIRLLRG